MNPIARALASEPSDSPRKAALFEILPLGAFIALAALNVPAFLFGAPELLLEFVLAVDLICSPAVLLSGLGWMGRGHKWIGGIVLLIRGVLSLFVFAEFNPDSSVSFMEGLPILSAWIVMPVVSASLAAIVPASQSGLTQRANH